MQSKFFQLYEREVDMAKRMLGCDVLGEVRRSQRILRRVEKWLVQCERDVKRKAAKDRERFEAKAKERVARTVASARKAFNVPADVEPDLGKK